MNNDIPTYERHGFATYPLKRKRGRPRKYPRPSETPETHIQMITYHHPIVASNTAVNDDSIGKTVHGFIDGSFDAGYLLTVKVANSETTLKGAVFKPGKYVPVSAENDILPNVPMIHRSEIPFPSDFSSAPSREEHQGPSPIQTILPDKCNEDAAIQIHTESIVSKDTPIQIKEETITLNGGSEEAAPQIQKESITSDRPTEEAAIHFLTETIGPSEGATIQFLTGTIDSEEPSENAAIQIQIENQNNSVSAIFDSLFTEAPIVEGENMAEAENAVPIEAMESTKEYEVSEDDILETQEGCKR